MNAKELTLALEALEARSKAAHEKLVHRMAADRAIIRTLGDRIDELEAKLAEQPRVLTRAVKTAKIGNHAQWMAAVNTLKAAGVEPANGGGLFDAETQVFPEMFRLFPALAPKPAPAPVEAKAPMASVEAEDEAMF